MPGSITTVGWCAVKYGIATTGSKREIVEALAKISLVGEDRALVVKVSGCSPVTFHSYGESYTDEEAMKDAIEHIFRRLGEWGYDVYRKLQGD